MVSNEYSPLATRDPEEQPGFTLPPNRCLRLSNSKTGSFEFLSRVVRQRQGRPSHGSVVILHVAFKLVAVLLYLLTLHSFITTFILVTLLLSADFWVVKNICGRLLAGLRWWSIVDEEGEVRKLVFKIFFQPQDLHGREVLLPITSIYYHLDAALNQHQPNISILSYSGSMSLGAPRSELWQSRWLQ